MTSEFDTVLSMGALLYLHLPSLSVALACSCFAPPEVSRGAMVGEGIKDMCV